MTKTRSCFVLAASIFICCGASAPQPTPGQSARPVADKRKFVSEAIDHEIDRVKQKIADPELAHMFEACYPNTLDTTVHFSQKDGKPDTFVITGDINAMWLRDSSAQVQGYLPFCREDHHLAEMISGEIHRQAACINIDPFANAFMPDDSKPSPHARDRTEIIPGVFERKWEVDSLCYTIRLAYQYWKITGDNATFDEDWKKAARTIVATFRDQQRKSGNGKYSFKRGRDGGPDGFGSPIKPTGMIVTAFRNSDDRALYQFNIPDNLFAVHSLRDLAEMVTSLMPGDPLAADCSSLADEVLQGVQNYGVITDPKWGKLYVYECDGLGHTLLMDDAGLPNLLSLDYFDPSLANDPLVLASRKFSLSSDDPWFFKGSAAEGLGSIHTGKGKIWPMGIICRALTSHDDAEIIDALSMLKRASVGTGFMHESFVMDDPAKYSRRWFAWVNNLFGELILKIDRERPELLTKQIP